MATIDELRIEAEMALNAWLRDLQVPYLYVDQSQETFATLFPGRMKRPDFLVLLESVGMIAVDAKNYCAFDGCYSISHDDINKSLEFERIFRIPVWYAYYNRENPSTWRWIGLLKALEYGAFKVNTQTQEQFSSIRHEHFLEISGNDDLGKLYTHRIRSQQK